MKIISKFKDYYDGIVQSVGLDENIIYVRNNTILDNFKITNLPYRKIYKYYYIYNNNDITSYNFCIVGVCGKLYPLLILNETDYIYNIEDIKDIWKIIFTNKKIDDYLSLLNDKKLQNIFLEYKVGSFLISNNIYQQYTMLQLEPCLKNIKFYTVIDAFTLFNEMSIFISEQLNTETTGQELSNKEKIISKGFDEIYGFRKRKK